jgi:hypothetical protein
MRFLSFILPKLFLFTFLEVSSVSYDKNQVSSIGIIVTVTRLNVVAPELKAKW